MLTVGIIMTVVGLIGLVYCISKAYAAKKSGLDGQELLDKLKPVIPINLASFFFSVLGLILVVLGIVF